MNKSNINYSLYDIVIYISIFIILYINSGYNVPTYSGTICLFLSLSVGIVCLLFSPKIKIKYSTLFFMLLMTTMVVLSSIINEDSIKDTIIMLSTILITFIFIISIDFKKYILIYRDVIYFLAIFSLLVYLVSIFNPNIIRLFPSTYYRPTLETYNLGFAFINLRANPLRNMSIFWEPGAYQTYLCFAILIELFSNNCRKSRICIFLISLVTTFSTTAFMNLIIFLIMLVFSKQNLKGNTKLKKILLLLFIFIIILCIYNILPQEIQYSVIGKITHYFESDKESVTSASVRFDSIKYPLLAFFQSPILGKGYSGIVKYMNSYGHTMMTCTPINWFSTYGIIYGGISILGLWGFSSMLSRRAIVIKILIFTFLLISISTEQYLRNISILIFIFYGFTYFKK